MKIKGCTFPEARAFLTGKAAPPPGHWKRSVLTPTRAPVGVSRTNPAEPCPKAAPPEQCCLPREAAVALVEDSAARLWTSHGAAALAALSQRGISDDVIRATRLGYCLAVSVPKREGDGFFHASGIVIPWFGPRGLMLVKIRQPEGSKPKYAEAYREPAALAAAGALFTTPATIEPGRAVVIVEGELDALCLASILGDAAAVVTLGSASLKPGAGALNLLLGAPRWYTAIDADEAGDKAAADWPSRAQRIRPPDGAKDWCDAYRSDPLSLLRIWSDTLGRPDLLSDANRLRVIWPGMLADPYSALERDAITHENE
jgi:DNA primase